MKAYESSVLRCHGGGDGCRVCAFLDGSRDEKTLLHVIQTLDKKLADKEKTVAHLTEAMARRRTAGTFPDLKFNAVIDLFRRYRDSLGLPDDEDLERACEFEQLFCEWICSVKGHDIGPDQCGKPEHDLCYRCHKLRTEIESPNAEEA